MVHHFELDSELTYFHKQAKRKRIAELSAGTFPLDSRRKSHWDFVLEEMAWLANDFMQVGLNSCPR